MPTIINGSSPSITFSDSTTQASAAVPTTSAGGWAITPSGSKLLFVYAGTTVGSLDSTGNFIALANVTAYGTP
jgi:hypothetical protein